MLLNKDFLLALDSSGLGEGEPDLGEKVMPFSTSRRW